MTNSLLWKIEKDNSPQSFLFGTIHLYDSKVFQIPDMLYKLIDSIDIYMPEADNRLISYSDMLNYMTVDDPDYSLQDYFNAETYARILDMSKTDRNILNKYKPFFISLLMLRDENMPEDSIDYELLGYASCAGKIICELENFESQIEAINNIPYSEQAKIVENALLLPDRKGDFNCLMNNYKEQNLLALKQNFEEMNPATIFIDSMLKNRNITMCNEIDLLSGKGYSLFIAVGAMHILDTEGVKGIASILGDKGYSVEALDFSFVY